MLEVRLASLMPYAIKVKVTRRKSMGLYITPDKGVELRIPQGCDSNEAIRFVQAQQSWIDTHLVQAQAQAKALDIKRQIFWQEGSQHYILGQAYTLKPVAGQSHKLPLRDSAVWLENQNLCISLPSRVLDKLDSEKVKARLLEYYRFVLAGVIEQLLPPALDKLSQIYQPKVVYQSFAIRKMKRRWGSCNNRGRLSFNLWLARFSPDMIEFVVNHEVAHLLALSHSPEFYQCLGYLLPDWRQREAEFLQHPAYHHEC